MNLRLSLLTVLGLVFLSTLDHVALAESLTLDSIQATDMRVESVEFDQPVEATITIKATITKAKLGEVKLEKPDKNPAWQLKEGVRLSRLISKPNRMVAHFPDAPPTKQLKILGNCEHVPFNTWVYTGLSLKKGDKLYIQSQGMVGYVGKSGSQPEGLGRTYSPSLMPRLSFVSLVGRAGDELLTNEWIIRDDNAESRHDELFGRGFVGKELMWTKKRTNWGRLFLAVNDSADGDNSGAYDVTIWIIRDGKVLTEADMTKPKAKTPAQFKDNASH